MFNKTVISRKTIHSPTPLARQKLARVENEMYKVQEAWMQSVRVLAREERPPTSNSALSCNVKATSSGHTDTTVRQSPEHLFHLCKYTKQFVKITCGKQQVAMPHEEVSIRCDTHTPRRFAFAVRWRIVLVELLQSVLRAQRHARDCCQKFKPQNYFWNNLTWLVLSQVSLEIYL